MPNDFLSALLTPSEWPKSAPSRLDNIKRALWTGFTMAAVIYVGVCILIPPIVLLWWLL